jgi:hypothetical protein
LVEDKVVNQKVVILLLKSLGHTVTLARNGEEALDLFFPGQIPAHSYGYSDARYGRDHSCTKTQGKIQRFAPPMIYHQ